MKRVLFVCTGNTCRSPMAEAMMRKIAEDEKIPVEVRSAGVAAMVGSSASPQAISVLKEKGIDHQHRSQSTTEELLQWAEWIFTMTTSHKQMLIQQYPQFAEKMYTLKEYASPHFSELQKLHQQLDSLYLEMESRRVELVSQHQEKSEEELDKILYTELDPLLKQEKELLNHIMGLTQSLDIQDPFGGTEEIYRSCLEEIEKEIRQIIKKWSESKE